MVACHEGPELSALSKCGDLIRTPDYSRRAECTGQLHLRRCRSKFLQTEVTSSLQAFPPWSMSRTLRCPPARSSTHCRGSPALAGGGRSLWGDWKVAGQLSTRAMSCMNRHACCCYIGELAGCARPVHWQKGTDHLYGMHQLYDLILMLFTCQGCCDGGGLTGSMPQNTQAATTRVHHCTGWKYAQAAGSPPAAAGPQT